MVEMYFARTNPIGIRKVEVIRATELSVYVAHPNFPSGRQVHRNTTKSYYRDGGQGQRKPRAFRPGMNRAPLLCRKL